MSMLQRRHWPYNMMDSFFDDFWGLKIPDFTLMRVPRVQFPKIDIKEEEKNYLLTAEVPGLSKDDINIEVNDNNMLTIFSEHKEEKEEEKEGYIYKEQSHRSFSRSLRIPEGISYQEITAKLEDGVLSLTIPKTEPELPKKLEINDTKSVWKKLAEDTKPVI